MTLARGTNRRRIHPWSTRGFLLAAAALFSSLAAAEGPPSPGAAVDMQWAVKIPMRDGVALNATIYRPRGQKDPLPAVFTLTPYIGDSYLERALFFAEHGYVFALVDVRGRGNSGGSFATVSWIIFSRCSSGTSDAFQAMAANATNCCNSASVSHWSEYGSMNSSITSSGAPAVISS